MSYWNTTTAAAWIGPAAVSPDSAVYQCQLDLLPALMCLPYVHAVWGLGFRVRVSIGSITGLMVVVAQQLC
jgi:hypothetical protein